MNETWIQVLVIVGSNLIIMLTFFGISISLHNGMREELRGIQTEIKEFHTKLAIQDLEFKNKIYLLEERNKK